MNFTPKSRQDIASMQLFPKGTYEFEIVEGCDKVSQAGNEVLELKVKVTDANGASRICVFRSKWATDSADKWATDSAGMWATDSASVWATHSGGM